MPKKPALFDMSMGVQDKVAVVKIAVGSQHSAAITTTGQCYTWGNNDNGALGRTGIEDKPLVVDELPIRITDVSCGDCHSVFYSTERNEAYFCGLYRVSKDTLFIPRFPFSTKVRALSKAQWLLLCPPGLARRLGIRTRRGRKT